MRIHLLVALLALVWLPGCAARQLSSPVTVVVAQTALPPNCARGIAPPAALPGLARPVALSRARSALLRKLVARRVLEVIWVQKAYKRLPDGSLAAVLCYEVAQ